MNLPELGNYRDAHLEIEALLRNLKRPIREDALQQAVKDRSPFYRQNGPDLVHVLNGTKVEDDFALTKIEKEHPHWLADWSPVTPETILKETLRRATIGDDGSGPSLKARGELLKLVGEKQYLELLQSYGCSPNNLKPGTEPSGAAPDDKAAEKRAAKASNPWSASGWSLKRQGELVKSLGQEKANQIAASVGCRIGSTRPNPKYN